MRQVEDYEAIRQAFFITTRVFGPFIVNWDMTEKQSAKPSRNLRPSRIN